MKEVNKMKKLIQVVNENGIPFNVRLLEKGEAYGLNDCLTHDGDEPLIEFYDGRYCNEDFHIERGQFVARYYLETILEHSGELLLYTDIEDWQVSGKNIREIKKHFSQV